METLLLNIATWALPVLLAITLHEVAHGWAALLLGDRTAQMLGRLSLNPLRHIDPIGTLALPLSLVVISWLADTPPFIFGWAKPVPVDSRNFRRPRQDMAWVAVAGPVSNFVQAIVWGWILHLSFGDLTAGLHAMAIAGISINLILIALNLLPLPPLDGSRIVSALLPAKLAWQYNRLEPYGLILLIALMALGWLTPLVAPIFHLMKSWVLLLAGLA